MAPSQVEGLKQLQASLGKKIDECSELEAKGDSVELTKCLQLVQNEAEDLYVAARNPVVENVKRALQPTINLAVRIAIDLNLFEIIDDEPISIDELAKKTMADRELLLRVLRLLASAKYFEEGPEDCYKAQRLTHGMRVPPVRDFMKTMFDVHYPAFLKMPEWFAANKYRDMDDRSNNAFREQWGDNMFDFLGKNPRYHADFDSAMGLQDHRPPENIPNYPYSESKDELSEESATLVDVGGGLGQYLIHVKKQHPDLPGRFILQDLPASTTTVDAQTVPFEVMAHDFFTPQPVIGAKFYHLRGILHDWPDKECLEILDNLRPAFKQGYSKLLIQTEVLTDSQPGDKQWVHMMDLNMWNLCGKQRDEKQWHELLGKANFKINRIVRAKNAFFAIIEADVA